MANRMARPDFLKYMETNLIYGVMDMSEENPTEFFETLGDAEQYCRDHEYGLLSVFEIKSFWPSTGKDI